jgi:ABC-2 type transport system permease protein
LRTILLLVLKDIRRFFNDRRGVILTFVLPLTLIVIFGNIFSGGDDTRGRSSLILVNDSKSIVAKLFETKLDSSKTLRAVKFYSAENGKDQIKFDEETAKEWVRSGKISAAVIMPKDFFEDTSKALKFRFFYDPKNEIESKIIQGNIEQTIFTSISKLIPVLIQRTITRNIGSDSASNFLNNISSVMYKYFGKRPDDYVKSWTEIDSASLFSNAKDSSKENKFMSNIVNFQSEQLVGKRITNPNLTRTVGGWAMMFLLFSLTGAATSLFEEKSNGTLKRLLCMPITRAHILWSKYIYSILLGMVQLIVMFLFSWLFFNVDIFANFGNLIIVIFASAAAAVAFGMLITSFVKTFAQANSISTLLILVMSSIGGSWFPTSFLPNWMQVLSKGTLTYWSVEAFLQVLWRHASFAGIALHVSVLLSIALLINTYALIRFKRGAI